MVDLRSSSSFQAPADTASAVWQYSCPPWIATVCGLSIKRLVLAAGLCASLSAELGWAQLIIHGTPAANPQTSLADLQKSPRTRVTLTQALAIIKAPALRDTKGTLEEGITIRFAAGEFKNWLL